MVETTRTAVVASQAPNPKDDFFHAVGDDPSWSESYYFYYFDAEQNIGGITRVGFRAHDGWKDYMHIVFLEGRRIVFCYDRKDMPRGDEDMRVGALSLDRVDPFTRWKIAFDGNGQDLADGAILITPKRDRPEGWLKLANVQMEIDFSAVSDPIYMFSAAGRYGHFEQPGRCAGHITVDGQRRPFSGFGLRDKSWGPRPWTAPGKGGGNKPPVELASRRGRAGCSTCGSPSVLNENLAFALNFSKGPDGVYGGGFLYKDGAYHQMLSGGVDSDFEDGSLVHRRNRITATFENGHAISGVGEILSLGPSKIPMAGEATPGELRHDAVHARQRRNGARKFGILVLRQTLTSARRHTGAGSFRPPDRRLARREERKANAQVRDRPAGSVRVPVG